MVIDKILFILSMIIIFYISVNSIQNFNIKYETIDELIHGFKTGLVEDIIIVNISLASNVTKCPIEYNSLIKIFDWPGTFRGCGCKKDNAFQFYVNECPSSLKECFIVEETNQVKLDKWKGNLICYKRSNITYEMLDLVEFIDGDKCDNSTHRICGAVDEKENLLCLSRNRSCPVTEIKFNGEGNNFQLHISHKEINITSEENNKKIFSFFRTDLTTPCTNPIKSPSSENFFPLMKNKFDLMCDRFENGTEIVDETFKPIDEYNLEDFYKDNNFHSTLHNLIDPFQIDISGYRIKEYARGYHGWSLQCKKFNPEAFRSFLTLSEELNKMLISMIVHSFICIAILISIGVVSCFISKYFELLFKAINLGFILFNLIFPTQIISNSNWVINILTDENGAFCGDKTLNLLLMEISSACLSIQYSFIIILLISIFSCVVFIYILYLWVSPATREVQEKLIELR